MFVCGMAINMHSDHVLRNLRKPGDTGYKIPKGTVLLRHTFKGGACQNVRSATPSHQAHRPRPHHCAELATLVCDFFYFLFIYFF